jgi:hypothetical protein
MEVTISSNSKTTRMVIVYRPPPSKKNTFTTKMFLEEFGDLLAHYTLTSGSLIIVGDFNFHVDIPSNPDTKRLNTLLDSLNYKQ